MNYRLLSFSLFLLASISSCSEKKASIESFTGFAQGTSYSIIYDNNKNIKPVEMKIKVDKILNDFDMSLSLYKDSSVLSRINRNEDVIVDSYFTEAFKKALYISEITAGAFDITVGPLVKAWGFGPDAVKNFKESNRDSLMRLVGIGKISLINGRIVKSNPGINLDFNAIAQGYSVDVICAFFDKLGIRNYLVEIGGEVRAKGTKAGALWRIGIDKPVDGNMLPGESLQAIIRISDKSISTSGNYRKFYIEDGVKYSHHIDPRTGNIAKNTLLSVTIVAEECALADGIATGCLVMGKNSAIDFINNHPELSAYFIFSDDSGNFSTWFSESLREFITEEN